MSGLIFSLFTPVFMCFILTIVTVLGLFYFEFRLQSMKQEMYGVLSNEMRQIHSLIKNHYLTSSLLNTGPKEGHMNSLIEVSDVDEDEDETVSDEDESVSIGDDETVETVETVDDDKSVETVEENIKVLKMPNTDMELTELDDFESFGKVEERDVKDAEAKEVEVDKVELDNKFLVQEMDDNEFFPSLMAFSKELKKEKSEKPEYKKMSINKLREIAQEKGVQNVAHVKKPELIKILELDIDAVK